MFNKLYYSFRPFTPRRMQVYLRGLWVRALLPHKKAVWPIDPAAGQRPPSWIGWPDQKRFALILTHDVESAQGHDKCLALKELEASLGLRASFNFVPERYAVSPQLRKDLVTSGFEVGVHGLKHDGRLYWSRRIFLERAERINRYLQEWGAVGFRSPAMHHVLEWLHDLNILYDSSTFDTDPFEPQPDAAGTIFPFWVPGNGPRGGYVELPYTLPQDYTLFVLMKEKDCRIWRQKLDWIAGHGGMALLNTHPDYMNFGAGRCRYGTYPVDIYRRFLEYVLDRYQGQFWQALPSQVAQYVHQRIASANDGHSRLQQPQLDEQ